MSNDRASFSEVLDHRSPAPRESRQRPSPQTAGEGPLPGGGRPPQHPTRHHEGEQPAFAQCQQELDHRTVVKN